MGARQLRCRPRCCWGAMALRILGAVVAFVPFGAEAQPAPNVPTQVSVPFTFQLNIPLGDFLRCEKDDFPGATEVVSGTQTSHFALFGRDTQGNYYFEIGEKSPTRFGKIIRFTFGGPGATLVTNGAYTGTQAGERSDSPRLSISVQCLQSEFSSNPPRNPSNATGSFFVDGLAFNGNSIQRGAFIIESFSVLTGAFRTTGYINIGNLPLLTPEQCQRETGRLRTSLQTVESSIQGLEIGIDANERNLRGVRTVVAQRRQQVAGLQQQVDQCSSDRNSLPGTVTVLQNEVNALQARVNELQAHAAAYRGAINWLNAHIGNLNGWIAALNQQVAVRHRDGAEIWGFCMAVKALSGGPYFRGLYQRTECAARFG